MKWEDAKDILNDVYENQTINIRVVDGTIYSFKGGKVGEVPYSKNIMGFDNQNIRVYIDSQKIITIEVLPR